MKVAAVPTALIIGVSGQDGAYLAQLLLGKGYKVFGSSRDHELGRFSNLRRLGIYDQVRLISLAPSDFRSVFSEISQIRPDEIYYLAGQSSVGLSFQQPVETHESITTGALNIVECLRMTGRNTRFFNAGSSECFGNRDVAANEESPFHPRSPYATAKAAACWTVANYREAYNLPICSGILFNHESPLRPPRFVTAKIVSTAVRIARGSKEKLTLGNVSIQRDWGWAPEYVEAAWRMLQLESPRDLVVCTGETHSLEDFLGAVFANLDMDWRSHVNFDVAFERPSDIRISRGDPRRAEEVLGWRAGVRFDEIIRRLVAAEMGEESLAPRPQTAQT